MSVLLDWTVITLYSLAIIGVGYWHRKRVTDAGGFLLGNRKVGTPMMIASTFAGGINANQPVSVAANTYAHGLSGMWLSLTFVLATPFFWMWPPVLRRLRIVTMVDFFRMRYGRQMEWVKLASMLVVAPFALGVGIKAAAILVVAIGGAGADGANAIGPQTAILMIILPTLVYTLLGGVVAVYAVDLFQSVLIILMSFLLLPFIVWKVGGTSEVIARAEAANPNVWNLIGGAEGIPAIWLFWFAISLFFSAPEVYGTGSGAARTEMASRWALLGNLGKRFCTLGWGFTGVFAIALLGAPAVAHVNPEDVFALSCLSALPAGLRGVMVAAMLATVMSTLANQMLLFGASLVNNLYKNYLVKRGSVRHYLLMARLLTALPLAAGWVVASSDMGLVHLVVLTEQVTGVLGVTILGALVWHRVTSKGAIASLLLMVPLFYYGNRSPAVWPDWYRWLVERVSFVYDLFGVSTHVDLGRLVEYKPENLLQLTTPIYLGVGIVGLILISLVTSQHDPRAVAEFYARAGTPLGDEQKLRDAGYQADSLEDMNQSELDAEPEDRDRSRRLLLLDLFTWPWLVATGRARLADYWIDFAGIAGSVLFIGGFFWMLHAFTSRL